LNESGYYWTDYGNSQVMYGIAPNEKESHVYIIDTDPRMEKWNELPQRKEYAFWNEINWVYDEMSSIEYKYVHGTKQFENARKALANIIEKMPIPTNETAVDLRQQLIERMRR
jgi:hypothetical protein